jgi:hypothetical protein
MKAGADLVMTRVFEVFNRTVPDDPAPAIENKTDSKD